VGNVGGAGAAVGGAKATTRERRGRGWQGAHATEARAIYTDMHQCERADFGVPSGSPAAACGCDQ